MEARKRRNIKPGIEYDHLFPSSENDNKTIRRNANVYHTVEFIPKVVQETLDQTKLVAQRLKGRSLYETCNNIWHFVYGHINYKKDLEGYEQIRSPARAWHDRQQGVDCDCYSVFISSILTNLDIPHNLRITKYHRDYFQHIYPIVPNADKYITIDCVTDKFDYEVPYSEKKDYPMDLQYLNGFDGDGMEELGKVIAKNMAKKKPIPPKAKTIQTPAKKAVPALLKKVKGKKASKPPATTPASSTSSVPAVKKKKGVFKKVLNVVNKVNPATVLLRNGVLAAMKLNIKNVAARLRWSYLRPEQAASKNIDPAKFQKLVATRQKLESIFFGAGGKIDNLKKAILGGKGNKDKAVSALGMLPMTEWAGYMSEYTPLDQLLGPEIYYSENVEGMGRFNGFGELGEPITLTSVAAAMGVIAGIVASLKQIGGIFKTKQQGSEDFDETKTDAPENNVNTATTNSSAQVPSTTNNPVLPEIIPVQTPSISLNPAIQNDLPIQTFVKSTSPEIIEPTDNPVVKTSNNSIPSTQNSEIVTTDENSNIKSSTAPVNTTTTTTDNTDSSTGDEKQSFWDKNKTWIKPVAIGVGGLTLIAIGFKMFKGNKNKSSPPSHGLSGVPHKKKKKGNHHRKSKHHHKAAVALL